MLTSAEGHSRDCKPEVDAAREVCGRRCAGVQQLLTAAVPSVQLLSDSWGLQVLAVECKVQVKIEQGGSKDGAGGNTYFFGGNGRREGAAQLFSFA